MEIRLRPTGNPNGYGSKIWLTAGGLTQYRQMTDGVAGMSQNYQVAHFGLNNSTVVNTVVIRWPDGTQTTLNNVPADQLLVVTQGQGIQGLQATQVSAGAATPTAPQPLPTPTPTPSPIATPTPTPTPRR